MAKADMMKELLEFAIEKEEEAAVFYTEMALNAAHESMKAVFTEFANEEKGHKARLLGVKSGKIELKPNQSVPNLKLGDYMVEMKASPDMSYQDALILAMQREKASFHLYTDLADQVADPAVRQLMLGLAMEEAKHKLRMEVEYDTYVLTEN